MQSTACSVLLLQYIDSGQVRGMGTSKYGAGDVVYARLLLLCRRVCHVLGRVLWRNSVHGQRSCQASLVAQSVTWHSFNRLEFR